MISSKYRQVRLINALSCERFRFIPQVVHYHLDIGKSKNWQNHHEERLERAKPSENHAACREPEEAAAFLN